jgi:two-component sensor histidine kinase
MDSLRDARQFVRGVLAGWLVVEPADEVLLVAHELAANALVHARSAFVVRMRRRDGWLRVEVDDASVEPPRAGPASSSSLGGRGLVLVDALAEAWGWDLRKGGKSVWVEMGVPLV